MKVTLKCPLCREKFSYDVADGWPDDCKVCHQRIAHDREDDDVLIPAFLSEKTRKTDGVARQVMDGSVQRAEMAAAAAGVPVSEMAGLKVTDLNDRRDSEIAFKKEVNDVTRHMDAMRARGMNVGFGAPADTSGIASGAITVDGRTFNGIAPRAGTRANESLKASLPRQIGRMTSR